MFSVSGNILHDTLEAEAPSEAVNPRTVTSENRVYRSPLRPVNHADSCPHSGGVWGGGWEGLMGQEGGVEE